jgi:predicted transcriptional regulator of viral defense system
MYRIKELLRQERKLFHTRDLALIWHMQNSNTLYTTIKRYVRSGILLPIHKGFYTVVPLQNIDPIELGISYLHAFAYLGGEYILAREGLIFQQSSKITLFSTTSKKFETGGNSYWVRSLSDKYLFNDSGLVWTGKYYEATAERAVADLRYFHPGFYLDNPKIDLKKVKLIQKEVGYP